jgi:hypothetical protein
MLHDELPSKEIGVLRGQVLEQIHIGMRSDLHVAKVAAMQVPVRPARQPPGCLHAMFLLGMSVVAGGLCYMYAAACGWAIHSMYT